MPMLNFPCLIQVQIDNTTGLLSIPGPVVIGHNSYTSLSIAFPPPPPASSHSYSSDIPPVISHASSDQSTVTQRLFNWIITANHIIHILENQSELTRMLMKQQLLITLPQ